jgi:hypothetical protein
VRRFDRPFIRGDSMLATSATFNRALIALARISLSISNPSERSASVDTCARWNAMKP